MAMILRVGHGDIHAKDLLDQGDPVSNGSSPSPCCSRNASAATRPLPIK